MSPDLPQAKAAAALAYLMENAPVVALHLDSDRRINQASAFALKILGPRILGLKLREIAVPFTPFPELSAREPRLPQESLISLETTNGSPQSFLFRFKALGEEVLALGSIDFAEQQRLEREILGINHELADVTRQLHQSNADLKDRNLALGNALANVKALRGLLPICAKCKKIRDDDGYWSEVEKYLHTHAEVKFTHGLCPQCTDHFLASLEEDASNHP
jgi:hypothetical protein